MNDDEAAPKSPQSPDRDFSEPLDTRALRAVLGRFATGVVVVTAKSSSGETIGITVNSFTSVSLDPPLILWCVANNAQSAQAFQEDSPFAINILNSGQADLALRFSTSRDDKFEGLRHDENEEGVPILRDCEARLDCLVHGRYPAGDHEIVLARVLRFVQTGEDPLIFYGGQFRTLRQVSVAEAPDMLLGFQ